MANKVVLISDDIDFFDYIRAKLSMRKSDELYTFMFDELPEKLHLLNSAVIIVNSETSQEKTLDLLRTISKGYDEDEVKEDAGIQNRQERKWQLLSLYGLQIFPDSLC